MAVEPFTIEFPKNVFVEYPDKPVVVDPEPVNVPELVVVASDSPFEIDVFPVKIVPAKSSNTTNTSVVLFFIFLSFVLPKVAVNK